MEKNIPSVQQALAAYSPGGDLLVVDDASSDGSVSWLEREIRGAAVITHSENLGFQAACTRGIREAADECVILLNTDVEVSEDFITPLVSALEEKDVFAAGCLALAEDGKEAGENIKVPFLGSGKLKFDKLRHVTLRECRALIPGPVPTFFATGGFMALKRSLFFEFGGFDELFEPFYYEDADLCYRAWKRGFRVLFVPGSAVIHMHKGSILAQYDKRHTQRIQERNRLLLLWKNLHSPGLFFFAHLGPLFFRLIVKWAALDFDFYAAFLGALKRLGPAMNARRLEKKKAVRKDGEIFNEIREAAGLRGRSGRTRRKQMET